MQKYKTKTVASDHDYLEAGRRLPGTYQESDEVIRLFQRIVAAIGIYDRAL